MARKRPPLKKRKRHKGRPSRNGSLSEQVRDEFIQRVEKALKEYFAGEDPEKQPLQEISAGISTATSHLATLGDTLQATQGLLGSAVKQASQQTKVLTEIRNDLRVYTAASVVGQLAAIAILEQAAADIKRLADQTEKIAASTEGIEANLAAVNLGGDYLPGRIYSWLLDAIETSATSSVPHYFTTFTQGDVWWPKFSDLDRENPLGPRYLGHKTDLDELCAFLADEVRPRVGPEAILHVFMPTLRQMALKEAVQLPDAMHPCVFNGQLGGTGVPFVYICFTKDVDRNCLRGIGVLKAREVWVSEYMVGVCLPVLYRWLTYHPDPKYYIDPGSERGASYDLVVINGIYDRLGLEPPRTLGRPIEPGTRPWYD